MKNCFIGRAQLFGDCISAIPLLYCVKNRYPQSKITWPVALKCKSVVQFLQSHPLIDEIIISEDLEGNEYSINGRVYSQKLEKLPGFDFQIDCNPLVKTPQFYNSHNLIEENLLMAGFSSLEYNSLTVEERRPTLYRDFEIKKIKSKKPVIFFQSTCGYSKDTLRSPSNEWWIDFFEKCGDKYEFVQIGHPLDRKFGKIDYTDLEFKDQFSFILGADLFLGLENGVSWCHGSFFEAVPMVTLITNGCAGHTENLEAWRPLSHGISENHVGIGGINNIKVEDVISSIEKLLKN